MLLSKRRGADTGGEWERGSGAVATCSSGSEGSGAVRLCSSGRAFPLSSPRWWGNSRGAPPDRACDPSVGILRVACTRPEPNVVSVNAGDGRGGSGDVVEALGRFEGGEEVDGLADVRTEAVR